MRNFYLFLFILALGFTNRFLAQEIPPGNRAQTETAFFNLAYWNGLADKLQLSEAEKRELIEGQRRLFEQELQHKHEAFEEKDIVWVSHDVAPARKGFGSAVINAPTCTNIDFEAGNMSNWVRSTGFNPLFNATGCCPNPNGDQTIMTGGADPYGGFPRVWPGGGSFSLRLGSTTVGGVADRISQTFFVTAANANFTYRYALVLNDGGHGAAQQPRFTSEIIDTLGNPVPCTFYQASAGSNTFGLVSSTLGAPGNNSPVSYKNWTDVVLDLTPNIGQNVTLQFTVYDCGPSGHFAYAYIDGICTNFDTAVRDTTCPNVPVTMCAPSGFLSTTWNGPGVVSNTAQCISVSAPGTYTCATVLVPGCPGPTFVHTLVTLPNPVITFTPISGGPCSTQYTFNSTSSISGGSITSYLWSFGDGNTSSLLNPNHTYTGPGTYQVKLKALTDRGCADSVITAVTVFPFPNLSFSPPSNCINTVIQFTNTSTIGIGSITGYTWALGNGANSSLVNPTNSYTANGTYTIVLNAISNQGCPATLTRTLGIFPPPIVSFTANPLCDYNGTSFSPATSTAIVSGSLVSFNWNFGDGGTSTQANPLHIYNAPGIYTVSFSARSNHNCTASVANVLTISPSPTVAVTTTSINACTPTFTFANNSAISDSSPLSYTWNFGGGNTNTTTAASLTYTFPSIGNYTVSLLAKSNMGCTDTVHQYISVYPFPVVNFSVPASCESAIFTVSTTAVSGSVTSYNWNFGDPGSGASNTSTLQNPTHFYSTTNPYTITLNILSNLNCPSTLTVPITVFPNPLAQFTSTTLTNCTTQFSFANSSSVQPIGASVITDYNWNLGPAGSSTLSNLIANFPGSGTYTVNMIVRTNHNCRDTATATLTIFPLPQLNFTLSPSCLNVPLVIPASNSIAASPGPSSVSSYTWNFGDGTFGGGAVPAPHTYSAHGSYAVTFSATSNMGCVASNSKTVDIFPLPSLTLTNSGNACLGAAVQFTGGASVPLPSLLFATRINFGDGTFSTTPTASRIYTNSGTYQAVLSATTSNECVDSQTISVVIHPVPTVSFSVNNNCLNVASSFSSSASISGGTVTSYVWNFGNGGTLVAQNPSYTYTTFGTYAPTVTAISNNGCEGAASNSVVIHPLPVLSFSAPNICQNQPVVFANNSTIALGSINSYSWNFDGIGQSSLAAPAFTFASPGIKTISLSAASNQTCLNTAVITLTVHPNPQSTLTTINNSCINDLVTLNPNLTIVSGSIPSTTITFGDGNISTFPGSPPFTVSHTYTAYSTYTVNITATSNNNCTQTFSTQVVVFPKPFVSFTVSNFCLNDSTNFTNLSIIPIGTISSHFWNFGAGTAATSTLSSTKYKYTAIGPYTVSLTELSTPVTGLTCSLTASQVITINPLPVLSFNSNTVCEGSPTQFTNTSATSGISGWSWDFSDNGSGDSNLQNPSNTFSTAGIFTTALSALTNFGCRDTLRQLVTVFANPTASFVATNNCLGGTTAFTNQSLPGLSSTIAGFAWNFNNGNTSSSTNTVQTYILPGTYTPTLTATSNEGCSHTFTSTVVIHPLPQISYSVNPVCEGGASTFTNGSTIAPGSISSYSWSFGDGNNSSALNPTHTYSPQTTPTAPTYTYFTVLTATSNQGCVNSGTNTSIIFPYPNSTVTTLNSSCINNQISFNPNLNIYAGSVPATTVFFGDGGVNTFTTPLTLSIPHTYTTYGTFTITVNARSDQGCERSFNSSVIIYPRPFVSFTSQNHCLGDVTQFTSSVTLPGTGSISAYNWNFSPLSTNLSAINPTIALPGATIYTVSLLAVHEPETGLFCNTTAINQVTIHALPSVSVSANNVCNGSPVMLTNHTPQQGITGWSWDFNNDGLPDSFQQQTSYIFPAPGNKTITLYANNTFNCVGSNSVSVTVYTNPIAAFASSSVCLGNSTTFSNNSQPGTGPVLSYSWNLGAVNLSTIFAPSITFTVFGLQPVNLVVKDNLGCSNTVTNQVEVYELPALAFVNNTACLNSLTSFSNASSISTGSIIAWRWDFDNDGTWDEQVNPQPSFKYPAAGSYVCKLEAESNRNCKSQISNSVLIRPLPTANFTLNTRVCEGDKIAFTNLSASTDGRITVNLWDFDGDGFTNSIDVDPAFVFTVSGIFNSKLQVTSQYGCNAALSRTVMVHPKAKPLFVSDVRDGCPDLCVNFQDKSIVPAGYTAKNVWEFGDSSPAVKNATSTSHCYKPGIYDVKLTLTTDSFGCTSSYFYPGFVNVSKNPVAAFVTDPEEIDEDQPVIEVRSTASDAYRTKFFISDGTNYAQNSFTHNFKRLDGKTKPMIVQVVENRAGCADTLYKLMNIKPAYVIYVPNVFTPNGDGLNDTFQAKGIGINKFLMQIFDRWGHVVYTTNDLNKPWDGTINDGEDISKQDVYVWKAEVTDVFNKTHQLTGIVTVLR